MLVISPSGIECARAFQRWKYSCRRLQAKRFAVSVAPPPLQSIDYGFPEGWSAARALLIRISYHIELQALRLRHSMTV